MDKKFIYGIISVALLFLILGFIFLTQKSKAQGGDIMDLKLNSSAFENNQTIPDKYTCSGADVSPPLSWEDVPENTKSFALIADDPDAPMGTWVHWVIYNIPAEVRQLQEGIPTDETLDNGALQGRNDFRRIGYGGPCPPPGPAHHYYFKLYALDSMLELSSGATKSQVEDAMEGHILDKTELIGLYSR